MLRETVADTSGCLDDLASAQRRVLVLRAGVGAGPPHSRGGVAKRLHISRTRVATLERTGLRRLRTLDRAGACSPPAGQTVAAADVAPGTASAATIANPAAPAGTTARPAKRSAGKAGGKQPSGGSSKVPPIGGIAGESATNPARVGGLDLTIPLLLLVLAAIALAVVYRLRRDAPALALMRSLRDDPEAAELMRSRVNEREPSRAPWIPWFRSTMRGPGWNDPRPPTDHAGEWSPPGEPAPEPEQHEEWTPPTRRTPTRRM